MTDRPKRKSKPWLIAVPVPDFTEPAPGRIIEIRCVDDEEEHQEEEERPAK